MMSPETMLVWFLRVSAAMFFSAIFAVVMPTPWMKLIAGWYGLEFPDEPLVQYLARSASALYAGSGATYWFLSYDVRRYLPFLRFSVLVMGVMDVILILIDVMIPMPLMWTVGECGSVILWTLALGWLVWRVDEAQNTPRSSASSV